LALPPPEPAIEVEPELAPKDSSELDSDELNSKKGEGAAAREQKPFGPLRVAFVGKPNAGKSSLMNRLVGVERSLVHHEPGTTMDPVDSPFTFAGRSYVLIDTAGIRRKARIAAETEKIAVSMALAQIRRADVVVLVVDGKLGPSEQDARLAGAIEDSGRAVVVALNKIDLLEGVGAGRDLKQKTRDELHFLPYAPVVMISAARGDGIGALMEAVDRVAAHYRRRISTAELNRFFAEVCETHPPPLHRGHEVRIHYLTQGGIEPPAFVLWANRPGGLSPSYKRFVKNQLRARYGFEGTPLRLFIKAKKRRAANELRRRR
jgi:GTP-binding protein